MPKATKKSHRESDVPPIEFNSYRHSIFAQQIRLAVFAFTALFCFSVGQAQAYDPDALWKIVNGQCLRHQLESGNPIPCTTIDLRSGAGFAVLKDIVGIAQFLVIPTVRINGVESPELLANGSPNYWAYAWRAKANVEERLHRKLARDQIALAVNSAFGRTQNQLHIHIDCIRPDVYESLRQHANEIGSQWAPLATALNGHPYWAMRILGSELGDNNPFKLLAERLPFARQHMDRQTLVLIGAIFKDGGEGFILLEDHVEPDINDRASGEELQDHECAIADK
jgi:CDP-diacylglycerol pyrophosphatase